MKRVLIVVLSCIAAQTHAQTPLSVIPVPVKAEIKSGSFTITGRTVIVAGSDDEKAAVNFLNAYLQKYYGFSLRTVKRASKDFISIGTRTFIKGPDQPERYTLEVTGKAVQIKGDSRRGTFYGVQTLLQLLPAQKLPSLKIPAVVIEDYPRFGYRGAMLDVCRHFFDLDFIKKYLDLLALHKINTFHWHLTDDQGWRIEIKKYPRLTEVGGCRNGTITGRFPGKGNDGRRYCGYYTQDQIKEIVQYAADRFITVIPEIELPGHSSAAIAAYPQLSCFPDEPTQPARKTAWHGDSTGKNVQQAWGVFEDVYCPGEYTFHFLQDVLDEVTALFPSKYIHIGGDECPKEAWKRSAFCQNLIKEKHLKDKHGLQSYFVQRIEKYLNSKGKAMIGWDEILEGGLAPNATVMSWRGEKGGIEAAHQKHDVIMTPNSYLYLDYAQRKNEDSIVIGGYLPLQKVYSFNPVPEELENNEHHYILGAQANLWTEYITNPAKAEYMLFPRLTALSEVCWSPVQNKSWEGFKDRIAKQFQRYDLWGIHYYPKLDEPLK
ncbi:beta-N-acetylhexosaminidase [Agriterribacter sp.]|uniref:beta-N-acetylhexosaminidase n=1 Tax=Agriterribacter sp. TaxID=2821509 RepID=UPI002C4E4FFB|nr:beta-N-acetylhexosaminidase [Agriterribacter sp.]HRP58342.1 beta-N-acetylhexosaminidase [Agriterribacter sp.]